MDEVKIDPDEDTKEGDRGYYNNMNSSTVMTKVGMHEKSLVCQDTSKQKKDNVKRKEDGEEGRREEVWRGHSVPPDLVASAERFVVVKEEPRRLTKVNSFHKGPPSHFRE